MSSPAGKKEELREQREAAEQADAAGQRKRTAYLAGGIALIALIVVVGLVLVSQAGDGGGADIDSAELFAGIEQDGFALGDPDAPVTVVEFADLQCPFCADFATDDLPAIVEDYVEPGDARMELRLLAFIGPDSETGRAAATVAVDADRLWPFAENFFANQGSENSGYVTSEFLEEQATGIDGLDASRVAAVESGSAPSGYGSESDAAAEDAGVSSTPSFLVGPTGGELEPVESAGDVPAAIDDALAEAGA